MSGKNHLSRLSAPKFWPIERKKTKWIVRPLPGRHKFNRCIALSIIIKNILGLAGTTREVKRILSLGLIKVDGLVIKDHRFPVGLMDTIGLESMDQHYRVLFNEKNKLDLVKISKEEANLKIVKIVSKRILKSKKVQLNFSDGRNKIIDKDSYSVSDSVLLDTKTNAVKKHINLVKGSLIYLTDGKQVGKIGVIEGISKSSHAQDAKVNFTVGKNKYETLLEYGLVIGKEKAEVSMRK